MLFSSPAEALKNIWGYEKFRPLQENIIASVLDQKDTLAILPTGGGKSICYQVPSLCREGIALVISPLIALMKDQVDQLRERKVPAYAIHSGLRQREIDIILENCALGHVKLLYISPERLKTELFLERSKRMNISLLAVDEAHCISQWGYDFRPPYLEIGKFRKQIPEVPVLALTASATPKVRDDIVQYLDFQKDCAVYVKSFHRPKLAYVSRLVEDKEKKIVDLLKRIRGTAVVYTRSRKRTKKIAVMLQKNNLSADFYHAGLPALERAAKQERWMKSRTRIMVATNAFGMGIDKPDVRLVIHLDLPDNIESYYQEAGRAGRDEKKAIAVILYQENDKNDLREKTVQSLVDVADLRRTYQSLANYFKIAVGSSEFSSYDFDIADFCSVYKTDRLNTFNALKKLQELGFIQLSDGFYEPSRVVFNGGYEEVYKFQVENARYEPLIKSLLRLYGGELYGNFTRIDEKKIAASMKIPAAGVADELERLQKMDVLIYDRQKDSPQLTFLTARYDAPRLPIDIKLLEARKKNQLEQMESMIRYVENGNLCRSLFLQHYFGEQSDRECGICDVCLSRRRQPEDEKTLKRTREKILVLIGKRPMKINELTGQFSPQDKEQVLRIVRQLLDSSQIQYDEVNFLHIVRKA